MIEVNVKEARSNFSLLLNKVGHGEEVVVLRHGKKVACLVPPEPSGRLPSLKAFREQISLSGESLGQTVIKQRNEERF
ncbi:MAG: type II toxin-antitoxin system prevent-host-death family antitoxin [Proteobacteria bacterium]|nr:type II toxin-antitoxin system prevent-host-death family antitoxin [Pseudomonadota bacterium]MBU1689028.1 type II toxin-antitoxin system prevent-host-death family antitoxin [Pseudomonadota bacterium]